MEGHWLRPHRAIEYTKKCVAVPGYQAQGRLFLDEGSAEDGKRVCKAKLCIFHKPESDSKIQKYIHEEENIL